MNLLWQPNVTDNQTRRVPTIFLIQNEYLLRRVSYGTNMTKFSYILYFYIVNLWSEKICKVYIKLSVPPASFDVHGFTTKPETSVLVADCYDIAYRCMYSACAVYTYVCISHTVTLFAIKWHLDCADDTSEKAKITSAEIIIAAGTFSSTSFRIPLPTYVVYFAFN